jgi:hypothetical protein
VSDAAPTDPRPWQLSASKKASVSVRSVRPFNELFDLPADADPTKIQGIVDRHVEWRFADSPEVEKYRVLVLYDDARIDRQLRLWKFDTAIWLAL